MIYIIGKPVIFLYLVIWRAMYLTNNFESFEFQTGSF